jgi:hypothetical protein
MAFSVRTDTQPVIAVSAVLLPLSESTDVVEETVKALTKYQSGRSLRSRKGWRRFAAFLSAAGQTGKIESIYFARSGRSSRPGSSTSMSSQAWFAYPDVVGPLNTSNFF